MTVEDEMRAYGKQFTSRRNVKWQSLSPSTSQVEMIDIAFRPNELTIPANADVNLHLTNQGVIPHNFKIDDPEIFSGDVAPGASVDLTLNLPSGAYEYYCTIPGHREAGMVGALTVE